MRAMSGKRSSPKLGWGGRSGPWRGLSAAILAMLLLLGACGGDDEASDFEGAMAEEAAARAEAAAAEAQTAATTAPMAVDEDAMVTLDDAQTALSAADSDAADATAAATTAAGAAADEEMALDEAMDMEEEAVAESEASSLSDGTSEGAVVELSTANSPAAFGRDVIYRAWVSVEAADVTAATNQAIAIVQGLGGFVFGQQTRSRPSPHSEIVFKVLPEDFSVALSRLSQVGELVDQQISADDVTERIVDLQSQIITAEASVGRLRSFLETATNLENVAFYERELLIRETDLERLRGQVRTLQDQVALATITLAISHLPERPLILPNTGLLVTAWMSSDGEDPCLGAKDLAVERNDTVDFCVEVANQGEVALTDVSLSSDVLPLEDNPFVLERGSLDRIEPGQFLTATLTEEVTDGRLADRIATRGLEIVIEATATPMDPDVPQLGVVSDRARVVVTALEVIPNTGVVVHAWVSGSGDDPCLGAKSITVAPDGDVVNLCVFVGNSGEAPITEVEIRSSALDLEANPLTLEHGNFDAIDRGQFLTATLSEPVEKGRLNGRVATRGLDIEIEATAVPLDFDGSELEPVSDTTDVNVFAREVLPVTGLVATVWASAEDDDPCLGTRHVTLQPDTDGVNLCLEIGNLGEVPVRNIVVESVSLSLEDNPFLAEHGNFDRLEPGQFLTATLTEPIQDGRLAGRIATRGLDIKIGVTATPVDTDGTALDDVSSNTDVFVDVLSQSDSGGFGQALRNSFEALVALAGGLAVLAGVLIPFLPVIAVVAAVAWWIRRWRRRRKGATSQTRARANASSDPTRETHTPPTD